MNKPLMLVVVAILFPFVAGVQNSHAQGPDLTPMMYFSGDDQYFPAAADQMEPDVELGDQMYLFVWEDNRADPVPNLQADQSGTDIYAARLGADGVLLDSAAIVVTQAAHQQNNPEVHWNGENWLVVWESLDINPAGTYYSAHIMAARVSPLGVVLDDPPIEVYAYPWSSDAMLTASEADSNWIVLCQGTSGGENDILGFRISPDGTIINPNGTVVVPATYFLRFNLDLEFATDELLFIWKDISMIKGQLITPELQTIGAEFRISPTSGYSKNRPKLASNGYDFLVGYEDYLQSWYSNPYVVRVSHSGVLLDLDGIILREMPGYGNFPRMAWDGNNWIAAWAGPGLYVARIDTGGTVLDPGGISYPSLYVDEVTPAVGGGIQVAYTEGSLNLPEDKDIFSVEFSSDLTEGSAQCVSMGAPTQFNPDIAGDGNTWMMVYMSNISGERRVMVRPFNGDGIPLDNEPVVIASGPFLGGPAIAYNGTLFYVTWRDASSDNIFGRRVDVDGTPLDSDPTQIMSAYGADVAAVGENFGVVGNYRTYSIEVVVPFMVRVRGSDGTLLDSTPFTLGNSFVKAPQVTSFDGRWLAVWQRHFSHDELHDEVMAALITPDGVSSGAFSVVFGSYRYGPTAAGSPTEALIAWQDPRVSNANWNIYVRRLLPDGNMLDNGGIPVIQAPEFQGGSSISWDGTQFIFLFEDLRNITYFFDERSDVYGVRMMPDGTVLDPNGFVFSNESIPEIYPKVASSDGFTVMAASVFNHQQPYAAYRVGLRFMGSVTSVADEANIPDKYLVSSSYPNPFNSSTTIQYVLPEPVHVQIDVYDLLGRKVKTLVEEDKPAGAYTVIFEASDLSSGVYFSRIQAGDQIQTRQMVLLK